MTLSKSTLKPGKPLVRKAQIQRTPMPRFRANKREGGAAHKTALALEMYRPAAPKEPTLLRSEEHRRNVAALGCVMCGRAGPSQCAHINLGKGMALKACDSVTFPACPECHRHHDQGGMSRDQRRVLEWHYVDHTRAELLKRNLWPASTESFYQAAIEPLKRVVE